MHLSTKLLGMSCGFMLVAASTGCGGAGTACTPDQVSGPNYKYATNSLLLPGMSGSYSIDIDGDGKPDNKLKSVVSAIGVAGFDLTAPLMKAIADGTAVILANVQAADLTTGCAKATLNLAAPSMTPPKFDGTDTFQTDPSQMPANIYGSITAGALNTTLPKDQTDPVQTIVLELPLGAGPLPLTIYGAHLQGALSAAGIMNGELHGVIRQKDIDGTIIPAVATLLTKTINSKPTDSTSKAIIMLFEDMTNPVTQMKCKDMTKCCATSPATCVILPDEVKASSLIQNVLSPDVQVFDANGKWAPVPKGAMPDSLSVGVGFTSVKANF